MDRINWQLCICYHLFLYIKFIKPSLEWSSISINATSPRSPHRLTFGCYLCQLRKGEVYLLVPVSLEARNFDNLGHYSHSVRLPSCHCAFGQAALYLPTPKIKLVHWLPDGEAWSITPSITFLSFIVQRCWDLHHSNARWFQVCALMHDHRNSFPRWVNLICWTIREESNQCQLLTNVTDWVTCYWDISPTK